MTSRVLMVSMGIITVTLAAAATAPSTNDTWKMKRQTRERMRITGRVKI
jgi:hypothetical protein